MITQREISQIAYREGMSDKVIEKDYVITWLLLALADSPMRDLLAFKGGTALKKIYFPDYRYSEDVDFTLTEELLFPIEPKAIHSRYSDATERKLPTYSLEEVLVEKLCAIIGRTEPRDVYDAHYLFQLGDMDFHAIPQAFKEKAASKGIDPSRLHDVLDGRRATIAKMWENRLRHQVKELPHLEEVMRELNRKLKGYGL